MGRAISDGVSDAYIQDLVVLPEYRGKGIGRKILRSVLAACREHGIGWIALIAEGGQASSTGATGSGSRKETSPMMYRGGGEDDHR